MVNPPVATGHARLSPSAASRWVKCPGSISMGEAYPDNTRSESAEEGTAAHWVGSEALSTGVWHPVGTVTPNGLGVTIEMVECAGVYVAAVAQSLGDYRPELVVEQPLVCADIHPECWGTPDLWYFIPEIMELHIWDYKHGFGIVEPYENYQLMCYFSGALHQVAERLQQPVGLIDQQITVVLHIVQPRPFHTLGPVREWRQKAWFLRGYINGMTLAAQKALQPNPECRTGSHCLYCAGAKADACETLRKASYTAVDYCENTSAAQLTPGALSREIAVLQRIEQLVKARLNGMTQQAIGAIERGELLPGWAVENGKGRQTWNKPLEEVVALGAMMGVDLTAPPQAITPSQAKKAGLPKELVDAYSIIPSTGKKLVPTGGSLASLAFKGGE